MAVVGTCLPHTLIFQPDQVRPYLLDVFRPFLVAQEFGIVVCEDIEAHIRRIAEHILAEFDL